MLRAWLLLRRPPASVQCVPGAPASFQVCPWSSFLVVVVGVRAPVTWCHLRPSQQCGGLQAGPAHASLDFACLLRLLAACSSGLVYLLKLTVCLSPTRCSLSGLCVPYSSSPSWSGFICPGWFNLHVLLYLYFCYFNALIPFL